MPKRPTGRAARNPDPVTGRFSGFGNPPVAGIETPLRDFMPRQDPLVRFEAILPTRGFAPGGDALRGPATGTAGTGAPRGGGSAAAPRSLPVEGMTSPTFQGGVSRVRVADPEGQGALFRRSQQRENTGARPAGPRGDDLEVDFVRRPLAPERVQGASVRRAAGEAMGQQLARTAPGRTPPADTRPPPSGGVMIPMGRAAGAAPAGTGRAATATPVRPVSEAMQSVGARPMTRDTRQPQEQRARTPEEQRAMLEATRPASRPSSTGTRRPEGGPRPPVRTLPRETDQMLRDAHRRERERVRDSIPRTGDAPNPTRRPAGPIDRWFSQ